MDYRARIKGFTLIELMITVVVVGILAAIALPSFSENIKKNRRVDAQTVLMQGAQWMERYFTENGRYSNTAGGATLPAGFPYTISPIGGSTTYYTIAAQSVAANTFTLRATPSSSGSQANDGYLEITNTGVKSWVKGSTSTDW